MNCDVRNRHKQHLKLTQETRATTRYQTQRSQKQTQAISKKTQETRATIRDTTCREARNGHRQYLKQMQETRATIRDTRHREAIGREARNRHRENLKQTYKTRATTRHQTQRSQKQTQAISKIDVGNQRPETPELEEARPGLEKLD